MALRLRLSDNLALADPLREVAPTIDQRRAEADEFYAAIHHPRATEDERRIQRQAFAGLLWSKQSYLFDVDRWLDGDSPEFPPPASRHTIRNQHWRHLNSMRVMTIPDKWEYPWFATWDLAFQCVAMAQVDPQFAKDQLSLMLFEQFQHPNGQIPAYEWEFSDLNPPVHAWAVWRVYKLDQVRSGRSDREFLERCFHKLLINFAWWINKVDRKGNNIFEGGFLGMDNITLVDRSVPQGHGAVLEQADATGWMGMFCLNLMRIALELACADRVYESLAIKFFQHYAYVASAMKHMGNRDYQLWDETDGFFYDVLRYPDGNFHKFRVRSLVGLIPLFAVERLEMSWASAFKDFTSCLQWFLKNRSDLIREVVHTVKRGNDVTHVLTIVERAPTEADPAADVGPRRVPLPLRNPQSVEGPRSPALPAGRPLRGLRARGSRFQDQGGQLELARPDLVPDQLSAHRIIAEPGQGLRSRFLGQRSRRHFPHLLANGPRACRPADPHFPTRRPWMPPRVRRRAEVPGRSALARLPLVL